MEKPPSLLSPKCIKNIPFVRHLKEAWKLKGLWEPLMENTILYIHEMFVTITGGNYNPLSFRISSEDQLKMLLTIRDSICQNVLKWHTVAASSTWKKSSCNEMLYINSGKIGNSRVSTKLDSIRNPCWSCIEMVIWLPAVA